MELFLVGAFAFLRPILFADLDLALGGLNVFELAAIAFIAMLLAALAVRAALVRRLDISSIDIAIALFSLWCVGAYVAYMEKAEVRDLVRLLLPFLTYTVVKNVIADVGAYRRVVALMLMGFVVPIVASSVLIAMGKGVYGVNYWTGVTRYEGIYTGPHNLAHNAVFFLMLLAVHHRIRVETNGKPWPSTRSLRLIWGGMVLLALFCLYKSATRTAMLGLLVFAGMYFFMFNRKMLLTAGTALVLAVSLFTSAFSNLIFDFSKVEAGDWDVEQLGSGRLGRWMDQVEVFSSLTLDAQLSGTGIGYKVDRFALEEGMAASTDSHNDYLEILVQTGVIGFMLFVAIQWFLLKAILRIPGQERYALLALFTAVAVMNFVSNSYVSRFGIGQMFYVVMAYMEVVRRRAGENSWQAAVQPAGR